MTSIAEALAGGSAFIKWDDVGVGHSVTGVIVETEMRQARKFQSTDLDFWDDGKPKMQAVITIQTDQHDDADDDGTRCLLINLWSGQKRALVDACEDAGVAEPQPGQTLTATWVSGIGRSGDPRIFSYALGKAPSGIAAGLADTAPTPTSAPAAPAPDPAAVAAALASLTPEQRAAIGMTG